VSYKLVDFSGSNFPLRKCFEKVLFYCAFDNLWNISIMKVRFADLFYVCALLFIYNLIKRELCILILKQRTVGKSLKYMFNIEQILVPMTKVDGNPSHKSWGAVNGFGGKSCV
jgi:hypothetical protein